MATNRKTKLLMMWYNINYYEDGTSGYSMKSSCGVLFSVTLYYSYHLHIQHIHGTSSIQLFGSNVCTLVCLV